MVWNDLKPLLFSHFSLRGARVKHKNIFCRGCCNASVPWLFTHANCLDFILAWTSISLLGRFVLQRFLLLKKLRLNMFQVLVFLESMACQGLKIHPSATVWFCHVSRPTKMPAKWQGRHALCLENLQNVAFKREIRHASGCMMSSVFLFAAATSQIPHNETTTSTLWFRQLKNITSKNSKRTLGPSVSHNSLLATKTKT